jgi:hypothetical protein
MKTTLTIISLFLCLTLQAQNCYYKPKEPWKFPPVEDCISGAGLICTFFVIENTEIEKRPLTATTMLAANVGVNLAVKGIRKLIRKHKPYKRWMK